MPCAKAAGPSTSARFRPCSGLSYVVAPTDWTRHMATERILIDDFSPTSEEVAAELLETGMFQVTARTARQIAVRRSAQLKITASRHEFRGFANAVATRGSTRCRNSMCVPRWRRPA
jgi:DNA-binding transcriptional MocR family regulator